MAASVYDPHRKSSRTALQRLTATRAFRLSVLVANVILPISVLTLMSIGALEVRSSNEKVRQAKIELGSALEKKAEALQAQAAAIAEKEKVQKKTEDLLAEQNRIREENARLG